MRAMLFLASGAALSAQQLTLTITNQPPVRAGNTLQISCSISGSTAASIAALQFSIRATIPGVWSIAPGSAATAAGKTFTCAAPDSTHPDYRCVLAGMNQTTINDGVVGTLSYEIPATAADGQTSIIPSGTLAATGAGSAVPLSASQINFTLGSPLSRCDLNSDGAVNIADVQGATNQALGLSPSTLDLDGDGKATVVDLQRVIVAANGSACKVGL